ncbi:hemophore-related protein [Nocardia sp. CDC159]|uniref:Hemophore-related protein n=1 Tax=Nocardia pulmonis TaxID=2951408 RepID=A0A9X2EB11_9NOCA|nr:MULTISPECIES: hemophore-related protein [Nocardia]MCM6776961.1 hemophore-related protein [Nocardia pulmonis]MCM6789385.1 hemophore-related protein [Nocardia sp. CDC159]
MRMTHTRTAVAALVMGAFTAGAALFGSGIASGDIIDDAKPLMTSSCSFAQVDAALHDVAPESAQRLDAAPVYKTMLQMTLSQPSDMRQQAYQQLSAGKGFMSELLDVSAAKPDLGPALRKAAEVCHQYPMPGSSTPAR